MGEYLHTLVTLNLFWCKELKSLQSESHLTSLRELNANYCFNLKELALSSAEIRYLSLKFTGNEILRLSIGRLSKLRILELNGSRLNNIPVNNLCCLRSLEELILYRRRQGIDKLKLHILFDSLRSLKYLDLYKRYNVTEIPYNISVLSSLKKLRLDGSSVESLPTNVKNLSELQYLSLSGCRRLRFLPELPLSITHLDASNCTSLETVFTLTSFRLLHTSSSRFLSFENCLKLDEHSLCHIMKDAEFLLKRSLYKNERVCVCFPGSRVPKWFRYNRTIEASVTIELAPTFDDLLGFVHFCVLPQFTSKEKCQSYLQCQCYLEDCKDVKDAGCPSTWKLCTITKELNSDHIFLLYDPFKCYSILNIVEESEASDQSTTYNPKLSFEFYVIKNGVQVKEKFDEAPKRHGSIKERGICPLYVSEYHNFIQEMQLELELGSKRQRGMMRILTSMSKNKSLQRRN